MFKLLKFSAPWCVPCNVLDGYFKDIDLTNIELECINIDEEAEMLAKYGLRGIPTLILLKDGEEIDRKIGLQSKSRLKEWLNEQTK